MKKPVIDGFVFQSAKDTELAKREYETLRKVREKVDINNLDNALKLYEKMVAKKYFETPVGLSFLHEMRDFLVSNMPKADISPVYVPRLRQEGDKNPLINLNYEKLKADNEKLQSQKKKMSIAIVSLVIIIVGMFFIVVTNDNIGYFNTEEKILNKYSAWEERLQNWEDELIQREDELDKREAELGY